MSATSAMARFNRVTNPVTMLFIDWVPGYAIVHHQGRVSGRPYRTPVKIYRRPGGYTIATPYGPKTDWVRNILAAGTCQLEIRGRLVKVDRPEIVHEQAYGDLPRAARHLLELAGVSDFLRLSRI